MIKVGITGSNGFIGKHLSKELINQGIKFLSFNLPQNDLLSPQGKKLEKFVRDSDVIVHTAAVNRGTDLEIVSGSVVATYNLIAAIKKNKSRTKLIFLSSIQAETETLYGQSKRLTEIMLEDCFNNYKIPVSILRLTNVFGEGCKPFYNSVVATFCYQTANGKELIIDPKSKKRKMNLIYVGDVVDVINREIFTKRKNPFYFKRVSTKNEITVSNLAKLIIFFKKGKSIKLKDSFQEKLYKTYLSYE